MEIRWSKNKERSKTLLEHWWKEDKEGERGMATSAAISSSPFLHRQPLFTGSKLNPTHQELPSKPKSFSVRAAKLPPGVVLPKVQPKLSEPFLGFTKTAEIWNSRACMIGLVGTFIVELIFHKGILQIIGVDVGKGLDLPL